MKSNDFDLSIIRDDICLLPGEPVVRLEVAPGNARRIFTGIDILSNVSAVWSVLTNYAQLHRVVPSLVKNEVLETYVNGSKLLQVGGAKVLPGITFTAKTVLDVRTYLEDNPIPEYMIANSSEKESSSESTSMNSVPLIRNIFPRPFALTNLPHRDITMQNVQGEGDFEFYQGIWRVQPLPSCAPDGSDACRLTYAVEIRPKGFLPVALVEGRIVLDLINNLKAIREYVERTVPVINNASNSVSFNTILQDVPSTGNQSNFSASYKALNTTGSDKGPTRIVPMSRITATNSSATSSGPHNVDTATSSGRAQTYFEVEKGKSISDTAAQESVYSSPSSSPKRRQFGRFINFPQVSIERIIVRLSETVYRLESEVEVLRNRSASSVGVGTGGKSVG